MAYENLNSTVSNFCRSPVVGTWCIVDTTDISNPLLVTKNDSGGLVDSHFILGGIDFDGLITIEYVGPTDLPYFYDGLDFIALEKVAEDTCIVKFMEINDTFKTLNLREEIIYRDFANFSFDVISMAVEYYDTYIQVDTPSGRNYIEVNNITNLVKGMRLFLGPSTDPDSYNECEVVYISSIVPINNRVYLTSDLKNEYVKYNKVSFYKYIYLISKKGSFGNTDNGLIIKIDPVTKYVVNYNSDAVYRKLTLAKWCPYFNKIALLYQCNILYVDPYDYYKVQKSQFLGNFKSNKVTFYDVYDVAFKGTSLYKLSKEITFREDDGSYSSESWGNKYNYQRDTLVPYVASVGVYSGDFFTLDNYGYTYINFKAADQFGIGLRDVELSISLYDGDLDSTTDPLSGEIITNIDGIATIRYNAGASSYDGITHIQALTREGSAYFNSSTVIGTSFVISEVSSGLFSVNIKSVVDFSSINNNSIKHVYDLNVFNNICAFSFFSSQGGNWVPAPYSNRNRIELLSFYGSYLGEEHGLKSHYILPDRGSGLTLDNFEVKVVYEPSTEYLDDIMSIANRITITKSYYSSELLHAISEYFLIYSFDTQGSGVFLRLSQRPGLDYCVNISQLFHQRHSYWLDGVYTDYLQANLEINQFIFVQDAIPPFWSKKNPTDTLVWLRLRPFASSLDADTVVMKIRQQTALRDTGYIDISNDILKDGFDAGGGLLGLEVTHYPPSPFDHDAVVYIYLSIMDVVGNLIIIEYWFTIIKDYLGPYLDNLNPDINDTNVLITTSISFDIVDDGTGIDISTFEMSVNSLVVVPQKINKVTDNYYRIEYIPDSYFLTGSEVTVSVCVADRAEEQNWLYYGYRFYTKEGDGVIITNYYPKACTYGVSRFSDVAFFVLDGGGGVDGSRIRIQVHDQDVTNHPYTKILPVIYRVL